MKIKLVLFAILAICATLLFSCTENDKEIVQNGIDIQDSTSIPYSEETDKRAENVIYSLLEHYAKKKAPSSLPEATISKLKSEAEKIQELTKKQPLAEAQYLEMIDAFEKEGFKVIDELTNEPYSLVSTKELYKVLSKKIGAEYTGNMAYHFSLYYYDYKYQENIKNYEKYGYSFLKEDAEKMLNEKNTVISHIGIDNFTLAVNAFFFFSELSLNGAHESSQLQGFTNEEVLIFLKHIRFSKININENGWELLLSYIPVSNEGTYFSKILAKMKENGDIIGLAAVMNDFVSLCASWQNSLTESDAEQIKKMDYLQIIISAFRQFSDNDWTLFEKITTLNLSCDAYMAIAGEEFGEEFNGYCESTTTYSLSELRASLGNDDFLKTLEGYFAGICPAFSYLFNYD